MGVPRGRSGAALCAAVAAGVLLSAGTAYAVWPSSGSGAGYAVARSLPAPAVSATCNGTNAIDVSWTSETTPVVTSFVVARTTDGGASWTTISSPVAVAGTTSYSVSESALAEADYTYRVIARNSSWSGTGGLSPTRVVLAAVTTGRPASRRDASCT